MNRLEGTAPQPAPMGTPQDESAVIRAAEDLSGLSIGRFRVISRLGSGGMGEVYRAEDTRLKRTVALKRVAPRLRADPAYHARFLKEAERASALNNPHIAGIYDVFEDNGELVLVMEHVEGRTLRDRLSEPLSVEEFLPIVRQCAEGLGAAHQKGILHGDIKPENVMLTPDGGLKILDFGVAKRLRRRQEGAATESLASAGGLSGTPAYMAPEVVLEKEVDARADIFSLGVMCYEALSGRQPFLAASFVATTDRILHEDPPPLGSENPNVSPNLERVVAKMMAKSRDHRYPGTAQLLADLTSLESTRTGLRLAGEESRRQAGAEGAAARGRRAARVAATALVAALILLGVGWPALKWMKRRFLPPPASVQALAVLPFEAIGGDANAQAFGDGLGETLSAKLSRLTATHHLEVVPASEVRRSDVKNVGQALAVLGVSLVIEGSLERSGNATRVTYSLVDAKTHRQLDADTITVEEANAFAVEDRVVDHVLAKLEIELESGEQRRLEARSTRNPAAYDDYVEGRGYLQEDYHKIENVDRALEAFNRALALDPNYAPAEAGRGMAYEYHFLITQDGAWIDRARSACERAVSLDGGLAEGHACLGTVENARGEYASAVLEFQRAVQLSPTDDDAYHGLASAYQSAGKPSEAEQTYLRAIHLRPQHWAGYIWLGWFYYGQARYADAAEMFKRVVALAPESFQGYSNLAGVYAAEGRYAEAIPLLEKSIGIYPSADGYANLGTDYFYLRRYADEVGAAQQAVKLREQDYSLWGDLGDAYYFAPGRRAEAAAAYRKGIELAGRRSQLNPGDAIAVANQGLYRAMLGEKGAALDLGKRAVQLAPADPVVLLFVALASNQLGKTEDVLGYLERARSAGLSATMVRDDPRFDNLRAQPRFQKLVATAN